MPWINVHTAKSLASAQAESLKSDFAAILKEILEKEERGLIVTFSEAYAFYRAGAARQDACVVDLRYIGSFPLAKKREVTRRIAATVAGNAGCDPLMVTVLFSELSSENWGREGGDFS